MLNSINDSPLHRIANPRSIAFFGASNNFRSMGSSLLASVRSMGFTGPIYPVHPKEPRVQTLPAWRSVLDLPEAPDLAVVVLPTHLVAPTIEDCGRKGVRRAIVVTAGFNEVGGEGAARQKELMEAAARHGVRLMGPNCLGVVNAHLPLNTTFYPFDGIPGFIGLASQSGSLITQLFRHLADFGLGFSSAFSVGNEADLDVVDCLEYFGACPETRVITLYIEGIRRGREFVEVARSITPRKPIVAFYIGGSETGRRAGLSHTGAMAGPDRLYDGIFRQSGVLRAGSITELFDFAWALGVLPPPRGNRVVIQTNSGGPGAAAADACGRAGLELPPLSDRTIERLSAFIPGTGSVNNPVDITFTKNPRAFFHEIPQALLEDENMDAMLLYVLMGGAGIKRAAELSGVGAGEAQAEAERIMDKQSRALARWAASQGKPVLGYTFRRPETPAIRNLVQGGLPVFPGPVRAVRALKALRDYAIIRERLAARPA
ncbi:MAG: CoA-binding protein [Proteobacteria bacterium]|nr:CoA-binding protein [Pseudomonadota bacterium]